MLGKRKRDLMVVPRRKAHNQQEKKRSTSENTASAATDIFRRHFETLFEPLPESQIASASPEDPEVQSDLSDEASEWDGLSDAGSVPEQEHSAVEVVEHGLDPGAAEDADLQRKQYKKFMVST
jgi:hypothetical protein